MDPLTLAYLGVTVLNLILTKGPETALRIQQAWKIQNPTMDDWKLLRDMAKSPDQILDEAGVILPE